MMLSPQFLTRAFVPVVRSVLLLGVMFILSTAADAGLSCHSQEATLGSVSVKLGAVSSRMRTGDRIGVDWDADSVYAPDCRNPLYLVLSTPLRTRFEGNHILALPAGQEGPFGIRYRVETTRVFIPLHLGAAARTGSLSVKVYDAAAMALDWAIVEVTARRRNPTSRNDLAIGEERVSAAAAVAPDLTIVGGNPSIVVTDRFAADLPQSIIRSNSSQFTLLIFDGYYRVLDAKTGELILERAGFEPNFSPTSRFLAAYAPGPGFEIIDLYSGEVVTSNDVLQRERGFRGNVHLAAWGPGDAYFALSIKEYGGIEVQASLVDGGHRSFPSTNCHYCEGIMSSLRIDPEAGIVAFQGSEEGWSSLWDPDVGSEAARRQADAQIPKQEWESSSSTEPLTQEQQDLIERRESLTKEISQSMLTQLATPFFRDPSRTIPVRDSDTRREQPEGNWGFPDAIRVSHLCLKSAQGRCAGRLVDWQEALNGLEVRDKRLSKLLVTHKSEKVSSRPDASPSASLVSERHVQIRGNSRRRGAADTADLPSEVLWPRIARLLTGDEAGLQAVSPGTAAKTAEAKSGLAGAMARAHPATKKFIKPSSTGDVFEPVDEAYAGMTQEAELIDPRSMREYASWKLGSSTYWLIRSFFDNGASSRNWLFLLRAGEDGSGHLADLTHRLRLQVGKHPSGLDENGALQLTEEFASTLGFGGWPSSIDRVSVAFDRYMIASGLWTIDRRRWALMVDLENDQIVFFNRELPEAATFDKLLVTQDGKVLLQANANGHLFFHDVASGDVILRGVDIDDELVLYDSNGYYASTPEGAHFVFLKFPGNPGYSSFQQFHRQLHRPDLVRNVLVDKIATQAPELTAPPRLTVSSEMKGGGNDRSVTLSVAVTSSSALASLRVFVDGRRARDIPLSGQAAQTQLLLALAPESRWVTVVALDADGYESVPVSRELPGAAQKPTSRLFAIAVGTDHYPELPPVCGTDRISSCELDAAVNDARRFTEHLVKLRGTAYAEAIVHTHLNAKDLRQTLLQDIKAIADTASERDTIMFFAAGHGFLDSKSQKFFLATPQTRLDELAETSIAWEDIAEAFDGAKARVVVFIDACHAGAAVTGGTHDAAVSTFIDRKASIAVIAAAKGRQESLEAKGGGLFTSALVRVMTTDRSRHDANRNGALELAEVYSAIKSEVVRQTKGSQTPWIARNLMIGETPLF